MTTGHRPLADRVREALREEPSTREVRMFGALAFMVHERMAVAAHRDGTLLVRVDQARHEELVRRPGARTAEMGAGRTMGRGWVSVAGEALAGDEDLAWWTTVALEHNRRAGGG